MIGPSSCAYLAAAGAQNVLRLQSACPNPAYRRHCHFDSQDFDIIVDCKVVIVFPRITPSILSFLTCSDTNGFKVTNEPGELSKRWAETLIAIAVTGSFFGSVFPVLLFWVNICKKNPRFAPGLISAINMWSVRWSARLQNVLTVAKLVRS